MTTPETPDSFKTLSELSFANGGPGVQATIKARFSDFRVDEDLGFEPTGSGEHLFVRVEKIDLTTPETARLLAERTGVQPSDIGYSGMKDRRAQTTQWFSLRLPQEQGDSLSHFKHDKLQILMTVRNSRKLKTGSHRRNHFRLVLRNCRGPKDEFERRLTTVARAGIPNYFGAQRFGRDLSNLHQVMELIRREQSGATERGGRQRRSMLFSAARAYLFNQVLSERLSAGRWTQYIDGDVLNLNGTDRFFTVPKAGWDASLQKRLESFDIHITGPLAGIRQATDKYCSRAEAAALEEAVLGAYPELLGGLEALGMSSSRRPLRVIPQELHWRWQDADRDSEGTGDRGSGQAANGDLALDFSLPRGAYATSLLREVCEILQAK